MAGRGGCLNDQADRFVSNLGILTDDEIERSVAGVKLYIGAG